MERGGGVRALADMPTKNVSLSLMCSLKGSPLFKRLAYNKGFNNNTLTRVRIQKLLELQYVD